MFGERLGKKKKNNQNGGNNRLGISVKAGGHNTRFTDFINGWPEEEKTRGWLALMLFRIQLARLMVLVAVMVMLTALIFGQGLASELTSPILRLELGGHMAMIWDLFFFDHGRKLISCSDDKLIRIFDVNNPYNPSLINTIRGEIGEGKIWYYPSLSSIT